MANSVSFNSPFQPIEKLSGRDNYRAWAVAMHAYLEVEDLWDTIEAPTDGQISTDVKKLQKAPGRIVLAVEPEIYAYIENALTLKDAWKELSKTFDDQGLARKVYLLQEATTTKLEQCRSMEDYVSRIISANQKLAATGTKLQDDVVGALLLAGLPTQYRPMIMALGSSGINVTADFVKTKLLEEGEVDAASSNFEMRGLAAQAPSSTFPSRARLSNRGRGRYRSTSRQPRQIANVRCYNCNRHGHYASKCIEPSRRSKVCTVEAEEEDDSDGEQLTCALYVSPSRPATHVGNVDPALDYATQGLRADTYTILAASTTEGTSKKE